MWRITVTILMTFGLLFAGLTPVYSWAIPLAVGVILCSMIVALIGYLDERSLDGR